MCKKLTILLCCVLFFANGKIFAQQKIDYIFRHINQSDGLLHTMVTSIVQDSKGFIWILTPNGLQRYDGSRFVNYPYDMKFPAFLKNSRDARLAADKKNNCIWLMTTEIEKLDLQKNKFSFYTAEKIMTDSFFAFSRYTDSAGNAVMAGDFGLYLSDKKGNNLSSLHASAPLLSPGKSALYAIDKRNGEAWMASWDGLTLFDKKTNGVYTNDYNPTGHPLLQLIGKKKLKSMLIDSKQNYWICSGGPFFYRYNALSKKMTTYSLSNITGANKINQQDGVLMANCFFEDSHHSIWAGTSNGGLLKYDADRDSFSSILGDESNKQGLHYSYEIFCIFQDSEENIWLGTDRGINIFNPYRQYFQSIHHDEKNSVASLPKNEINHYIQAANGNILAGTWGGGITVYDSNWNFIKNISFPKPDEYNLVWSFIQNDDGNIWIGCQHGYIHIYNPLNGSISTVQPPELKGSTIWCMTKDRKGNIWLGLHNGRIAKWNKQQDKFFGYNDSAQNIPQQYGRPLTIFFDSRQRCWAGTMTGFKQFDTEKRMYSAVYTMDEKNRNSISYNNCEGIEEYDDTTLLIGTVHGGLNFFNPDKKTFTHLTAADGLPSNTIHAIKKDAAGFVWFTTDYGLYKFKPPGKKFIRLNIYPGTINSEFKTAAFIPLQDGRWLTATATEMICFHPQNNSKAKGTDAKVEITGFKIFDSSIVVDSLLDADKPVRLEYKQNFLTIEFALLNFSNLQQTNYYYRLEGVDKDWVNAGSKQFASYTNLEPGEYTFTVKADDSNDASLPASFKIIITPPFWKTQLFRFSLLLASGILIYWLFKRRIKTVRAEAGMKQRIAETEMMALRAQMNPHFIFNCLNSIDNLIQENEKEKATLYLAKFAKLIRSILENSKSNVVPCWKDMETLKLYLELEELRCDKKFLYKITIADEILHGDYKVPPLVIQPFVENAIHHGLLNKIEDDKILTVDVKVSSNHIYYRIEDNGVGRAKAAEYKSINSPVYSSMGMQITADRINLFNQNKNSAVKITDLVNEKNEAAGTRVEVELINQ
jgi:ligand-binding sensor domain-containing protein